MDPIVIIFIIFFPSHLTPLVLGTVSDFIVPGESPPDTRPTVCQCLPTYILIQKWKLKVSILYSQDLQWSTQLMSNIILDPLDGKMDILKGIEPWSFCWSFSGFSCFCISQSSLFSPLDCNGRLCSYPR